MTSPSDSRSSRPWCLLRIPSRVAAGLALAAAAVDQAPAQDSGTWVSLDEQVEALFASRKDEAPPFEIGGYLMPSLRMSNDPVWTTDPDTFEPLGDLSEFGFQSANVSLETEVAGYEGKIGWNPVSQKLRSTYVRFRPWDPLRMTLGRFKGPLLRSRNITTTRLLFPMRTAQARQTGDRAEGLKLEWDLNKRVEWTFSAQNGEDDLGSDLYLVTRLEAELLGGGVENYEGAWKADDHVDLTLGLGLAREEALEDGEYQAVDLALTWRRFSLAGEWLSYPGDEPDFPGQDKLYDFGIIDPISRITWTDTKPWGATVGFMLLEDRLEAAVRVEELDDANHTSRLGVALNRYVKGHDLKWQAAWFDVDSDLPLLESQLLVVGLVLRF